MQLAEHASTKYDSCTSPQSNLINLRGRSSDEMKMYKNEMNGVLGHLCAHREEQFCFFVTWRLEWGSKFFFKFKLVFYICNHPSDDLVSRIVFSCCLPITTYKSTTYDDPLLIWKFNVWLTISILYNLELRNVVWQHSTINPHTFTCVRYDQSTSSVCCLTRTEQC